MLSPGARRLGDGGHHGREKALQSSRAGDVVGMTMRVDGVLEVQAQLLDILGIALCCLHHRINEAVQTSNKRAKC